MKFLDLVLEDVSPDEWVFQLYYMDRKYPFYLDLDPRLMSVLERQQAIHTMLATVFREEAEEALNTRPRDTPEGRELGEWYDMINDMTEGLEDDLEGDVDGN